MDLTQEELHRLITIVSNSEVVTGELGHSITALGSVSDCLAKAELGDFKSRVDTYIHNIGEMLREVTQELESNEFLNELGVLPPPTPEVVAPQMYTFVPSTTPEIIGPLTTNINFDDRVFFPSFTDEEESEVVE